MNKVEEFLSNKLSNLNCYFEVTYTDILYKVSVYDNKHNYLCGLVDFTKTALDDLAKRVSDVVYDNLSSAISKNSINHICEFKNEYAFLDNCYPVSITYKGLTYTCVQSAFEASKETSKVARILYTTMDGYTAMYYPTNRIYSNWEHKQDDIMYELLIIKFNNEELKQKLINTKDSCIEYINSWHENYWGICDCENCSIKNYNKLGIMLMKIRENLQNEKKV